MIRVTAYSLLLEKNGSSYFSSLYPSSPPITRRQPITIPPDPSDIPFQVPRTPTPLIPQVFSDERRISSADVKEKILRPSPAPSEPTVRFQKNFKTKIFDKHKPASTVANSHSPKTDCTTQPILRSPKDEHQSSQCPTPSTSHSSSPASATFIRNVEEASTRNHEQGDVLLTPDPQSQIPFGKPRSFGSPSPII